MKSLNSSLEKNSQENSEVETLEEGELANDANFSTPSNNRIKKRKILDDQREEYGNVSIKIAGTPILENISGVEKVPSWEKFSANICDHRPFEMESSINAIGNFKNIIELTRKFKSEHNSVSH